MKIKSKDLIVAELKRQKQQEDSYNKPFREARQLVDEYRKNKENSYNKFKRQQTKERELNDRLVDYLGGK